MTLEMSVRVSDRGDKVSDRVVEMSVSDRVTVRVEMSIKVVRMCVSDRMSINDTRNECQCQKE